MRSDIGLTNVSENMPLYMNRAVKDIIRKVLAEYRTADETELGTLNRLRERIVESERDIKDLFYALLLAAIDIMVWEYRESQI